MPNTWNTNFENYFLNKMHGLVQTVQVLTVKLSLSNCIISVLSLYDSSLNVSSSAMASSKACNLEKSTFVYIKINTGYI